MFEETKNTTDKSKKKILGGFNINCGDITAEGIYWELVSWKYIIILVTHIDSQDPSKVIFMVQKKPSS